MDITLYTTKSANNKLKKVLETPIELKGTLRDGTSILSPVIMIQQSPMNSNYAYIPQFKRYYYIEDTNAYRNYMFIMQLRCDVLMTYETEIQNMTALITRVSEPSEHYPTGGFTLDARKTTTKIDFESPFTEDNYILVTMKGGGK